MESLELWLYLWHWSPKSRRRSIEKEGLRRCSWSGRRLVSWAAELDRAASYKRHVAALSNEAIRNLDGWLVRVMRGFSAPAGDGSHAILHDIPAFDLRRMHVVPTSQAEAEGYLNGRYGRKAGKTR